MTLKFELKQFMLSCTTLLYVNLADSSFLLYSSDMVLSLYKLIANINFLKSVSIHIKFKRLRVLKTKYLKP